MTAKLKGLVLAGGFSRRMGSDKALLDYHGKPQAIHAYEQVAAWTESAWVSCREGQLAFDVPQLHDRIEGQGPMGGILRAFEEDPDAAWLVVACDLPLLSEAVLELLIAERDPDKIATAFRASGNGLPEPLCAIYEPASASILREWLAQDRRCPRKVLITQDEQEGAVRLLDLPGQNPLDNANVPEDIERLKEAL